MNDLKIVIEYLGQMQAESASMLMIGHNPVYMSKYTKLAHIALLSGFLS